MDAMTTRLDGPSPEREIALDLAKWGVRVAPAFVLVGALGWGTAGALSAGYALAIVLANFLLSAFLLSGAARISLGLVMGAALFGYLFRLGLVFAAVMLVRNASWVDLWPLGLTLVVAHLGLLFWETRFISASLAFPTLKPKEQPVP